MTTARPESPSPAAVAAKIRELQALEATQGARVFAEALADNIVEPDPVETAAFRSDELARLSMAAATFLLEHSAQVLRERRRKSREAYNTRRFQMSVTYERRILDQIVRGINARQGRLNTQPNPRRRAERRLVKENLEGPVPKGRFIELLREEEEKLREAKRDAKRRRSQARKNK